MNDARASQLFIGLVAAFTLAASGCGGPPAVSSPPKPWSDPDGRFTIDVTGTPVPRAVQEITFIGTVNFKVYAIDDEIHYRVSAFAYPWEKGQPFDLRGELWHASGKAVARMGGKPDRDDDVTVDGIQGKDIHFSFTTPDGFAGHGVQRMLIREEPPARYHAFCIAPLDVDLAPCEAFLRSFHPIVPH